MALDVQRISLDISKQPTPQQVRLGQGDANATRLIIDVFDDGIAYSLTSYNVRLSMHLPNEGGYYQVNGTKSGNTATFDIDERYAATTYGFDGFGYVDILNGETVICSTSRFQLVVLRNAADGVELSEQYINAVEDAVNRANEAAEAAEGIVLQAVPTMSANIKGGAKLGSGLTVSNDTLSVDASTIASGVLPVARGGTGAGTAAGALTSLGAVAKSGDIMTGFLNLKSSNIDRDGGDPSSDVTGNSSIKFVDNNGELIGGIDTIRRSNGRQDLRLFSFNEKSDGSQVQNFIQIQTGKDGTQVYGICNPAAFRNAIGAVNKAGDTITGNLYSNSDVGFVERTTLNTTQTPSANTDTNSYQVVDSNDILIGQLRSTHGTDGTVGYRLVARQGTTASGGIKQAYLGVNISPSGVVSYTISSPEAFCSALHVGDWVVKDQTTNVSMANNAYSNLCSISLPAGTWIVTGQINWASNATGMRMAYISTTSQTYNAARAQSSAAINGASTQQNVSGPLLVTATQTVYLVGWQNSGAALNATGYLRAVRIK